MDPRRLDTRTDRLSPAAGSGTGRAIVIEPHLRGSEAAARGRSPDAKLDEAIGLAQAIDLEVLESGIVPVGQLRPATFLGKGYIGRRLYLLYNPATGRTNGTTNNFFAAITIRPPSINDKPHRHSSAAINYFFGGTGKSIVDGKTYYWKAGDLMLTAPGWAIHNHSSNNEPVYELTIQDQPLNLAMDSLLWQEDLRHPPRLLGSHKGFSTNRRVAAKS